jgi:thioredoxin reductase
MRLDIVRRTLGPSGGYFVKDKVVGKVPMLLGHSVESADVKDAKVVLSIRAVNGNRQQLSADHVIAATGYKVDLGRLTFLSSEIRSALKQVNRTPLLSSEFESSVPGLYFVGIAAANTFGPVMRFAYGADFAARTVARALRKSRSPEPTTEVASAVSATK